MTHCFHMAGKKLLVADDSLTIQKVIRLALSHEGYEIVTVSDGAAALEQLSLFRPQIVLIDVSLPGKSAIEVKQQADENPELRGARYVLMSSAFEQVDEGATEKAGFHARLTKPFDPAHLRKVLADNAASSGEFEQTSPSVTSTQIPVPPPLPQLSTEMPKLPPLPELPPIQAFAPPAPPSFAPTPVETKEVRDEKAESDIRVLTQSTLKLAGLDEIEWTVNEGARKDSFRNTEPALPPLPRMMMGSSQSQVPATAAIDTIIPPLPKLDFEDPAPVLGITPEPEPLRSTMNFDALDHSKIELLVREQVEAALERMSRDLLPQIAERLIKQEIHRLLDEGP